MSSFVVFSMFFDHYWYIFYYVKKLCLWSQGLAGWWGVGKTSTHPGGTLVVWKKGITQFLNILRKYIHHVIVNLGFGNRVSKQRNLPICTLCQRGWCQCRNFNIEHSKQNALFRGIMIELNIRVSYISGIHI